MLAERFLINRDFAKLYYGMAVSTVGDFVFTTTLVLWIATILAKDKPWAPAAVSGLVLCVSLAIFLIAPLAGVFVDRMDRHATLLRTEVVRAALVGGLAVLSFLPTSALPVGLWLGIIYLTVFLENAAGQFFGPSRFAILGQVVTGEGDRARAAGMEYATSSVALIIGPPLAAPLLFSIGLQCALLVNAASYVFSYFVIRSMSLRAASQDAERPDGADPGSVASLRADFVAGLRAFAGNRYLVALLAVAVICQVGTSALNALDIFFVTDNLHASAKLYGFVMTAFGAGSIVGALLLSGRVVRWFGARTATVLCLVTAGVLIVLYAKQTNFAAGLVVFTLVAMPVAAVNAAITPLLLAAIPDKFMGRIMGVFGPANQLASMAAVVVWGWLASTVLLHFDHTVAGIHFGRMDTVFALSGALILLGGVYGAFALPRRAGGEEREGAVSNEAASGDPASNDPATVRQPPG